MISVQSLLISVLLCWSHSAQAQDQTVSSNTSTTPASSSGSSSGLTGLIGGLSTTCQAASGGLLSSDFGTCANIIGLVSVIGAQGSVIPPLTKWIQGICTSSPCSASTLSSAQSTINSGCSSDVQKGTASAVALSTIVANYPQIRDLLCLQNVANSTYCVPEVLTNVQTAVGRNLTMTDAGQLLGGGLSDLLSKVPSTAYCVDCGHAIWTEAMLIKPAGGSVNTTAASSGAAAQCGASFTDGKIPSSVKAPSSTSASQNAQNSSGNGLSVFKVWAAFTVAAVGLATVVV